MSGPSEAVLLRAVRGLRWAAIASAAAALLYAFLATPEEAVMGSLVRILYVHAGVALTAYLAFGVTALAATAFLVTRRIAWDWLAAASGEWGLVLATATLVSGSLWARPTQGWWWRWDDARLTLTLLLWFVYAAYVIVRQYATGRRRATLSAVIALAGVPTIVLDHLATRLFPAFHPPPVAMQGGGSGLAPAFRVGLALSVCAFTIVYAAVLGERFLLEARKARLEALRAERWNDPA